MTVEEMAREAAWEGCPHRRRAEEIDGQLSRLLGEPTFLRPSSWPRVRRLLRLREIYESRALRSLRNVSRDVAQG